MESELKQYMSNVDEVISLLKQKVERIENERSDLQALCDRYEKALKEISGHAGQLLPPKHEMIAIANEALAGGGEREVDNG